MFCGITTCINKLYFFCLSNGMLFRLVLIWPFFSVNGSFASRLLEELLLQIGVINLATLAG